MRDSNDVRIRIIILIYRRSTIEEEIRNIQRRSETEPRIENQILIGRDEKFESVYLSCQHVCDLDRSCIIDRVDFYQRRYNW